MRLSDGCYQGGHASCACCAEATWEEGELRNKSEVDANGNNKVGGYQCM